MISGYPSPAHGAYAYCAPRLSAQSVGLSLTWLTIVASSAVFAEPAPYDALMLGLMAMLPLLGLTALSAGIFLFFILWLVIGAATLIAATKSSILDISVTHSAISIYLSISAVLIAAFVRKEPEKHTRIIISGFIFAALIAVSAGIVGYFELLPGANELFTKYGRIRGTFKDPNVFGPFIVLALLYCIHSMATGRARRVIMMSLLTVLFSFGLLMSFSRGAILNLGISLLVYASMMFMISRSNIFRFKLLLLVVFTACGVALITAAALQIDSIAALLRERASLILPYDAGPEGRFGGQILALDIISRNPIGIGAQEFGRIQTGQDVHNVYLSMFLNAGWIGGFLYIAVVVTTLVAGFRHALRRIPTQGVFIVMLAAFAGLAAEGLFVDTDHWRHFYLIMGIIWGLMLSRRPTAQRPAR